MDLVGEDDAAAFIDAELVFGIDQDKPALGGQFLPARKERQRISGERLPLLCPSPAASPRFHRVSAARHGRHRTPSRSA
jgi:hypothetical protein